MAASRVRMASVALAADRASKKASRAKVDLDHKVPEVLDHQEVSPTDNHLDQFGLAALVAIHLLAAHPVERAATTDDAPRRHRANA